MLESTTRASPPARAKRKCSSFRLAAPEAMTPIAASGASMRAIIGSWIRLDKNTGTGNLFVVFGEPDVEIDRLKDGQLQVRILGLDIFDPQKGEVRPGGIDDIAAWFIDTDYNEESFFVRHAYFLGAQDPYKALKTTLKAEIDEDAWASLYRNVSRPFPRPTSGRLAVKVINHFGDEVMKVFSV